jgi:IclR family KDG regulon transcriptional repressor
MGTHSSLKNAIQILDTFTVESKELGVTDVSRKLNISAANASRLLKTMELLGIVVKNTDSRKYLLGSKVLDLARTYLLNVEIKEAARPYLRELSEKTNELITLSQMKNDQCVLVDWIESKRSIRQIVGDEFMQPPIYAVAPGKLLLSYFSDKKISEILYKIDFVKFTSHTIIDKKELIKQIDQIRLENLAISNEERHEHLLAVSAPVYNIKGKVVAAIAISWLNIDNKPEYLTIYKHTVKEAASGISKNLGYRFDD